MTEDDFDESERITNFVGKDRADYTGLSSTTIINRLNCNWDVDKALYTKSRVN